MQRYTFAIDQGNTSTKAAIFDGDALIAFEKCGKQEESQLEAWIIGHQCKGGIVSSVREHTERLPEIAASPGTVEMSNRLPLPIAIQYHTPHTLGSDRIANAAAALIQGRGPHALIIDCGSCLTVTCIQNQTLVGGSISPGLHMRFKALHAFTGRLPLLANLPSGIHPLGTDTDGSILSGVYYGLLAEIEEIIDRYCRNISPLNVIITGGDAGHFVPRLKSPIFAEPFLTLMGLHEIYKYQLLQNN